MDWKNHVARIIGHNLQASPISEAAKAQVIAEAIDAFDAPPVLEESKPQDAPQVRGESLEALRRRAHEWGGWEPWLAKK
jgi:hypothetical protein